jgi:hypothetical protein
MPQLQLQTDTSSYWAASSGFVAGRDALGIQNSSVALYSILLPGITNVSERIRYFGFNCWLLKQYHDLDIDKESKEHQYNFIRRGELVISFLMQHMHPDYGSVPGKAFAGDFYEQLKKEGHISIGNGANLGMGLFDNNSNKRLYWKNTSGAFGQYFYGAMSLFDLTKYEKNGKYFHLTEKGQQFASIMEETYALEEQKLLLSIIKSESLSYDQLDQLASFDISAITENSTEWNFYIDSLFGKDFIDRELFQRRATLCDYLHISNIDQSINKHYITPEYYFKNPLNVDFSIDSASLGWFIYYSQETIHYALESIFDAMLTLMRSEVYRIDQFIDHVCTEFLSEYPQSIMLSDYMSTIKTHPIDILEELKKYYKDGIWSKVYLSSFDLILSVYSYTESYRDDVNKYLEHHNISGKRGSLIEMITLINKNEATDIHSFFRSLITQLLNDHQMIAFDKMGNGHVQVHKFIIEHNHLFHIANITPRFTTPRLNSARLFLEDLSLLDRDTNSPTNKGLQLINQYKSL